MKTRVYAVAEWVPDDSDYLTVGKLYEVLEADEDGFDTIDDVGDRISTLWSGSSHLAGDHWTRLELPDIDPRDVAELIEVLKCVRYNIVSVDVCVPRTLDARMNAILNKIEAKE